MLVSHMYNIRWETAFYPAGFIISFAQQRDSCNFLMHLITWKILAFYFFYENNLLRAKEESLLGKMVSFFIYTQSSCCTSQLWPH